MFLLLTFALLAFAAQKNPILPGWNPDPSFLRVGSDYFIATSTFEYFPGHPIYHSKDLKDWALIGHALNRPSQLALFGTPSDAGVYLTSHELSFLELMNSCTGVWAPSLRYHNGTFYLASTTRYVYTCEQNIIPSRSSSTHCFCSRAEALS
jgi:beta-xylosidase